jgi:serine phosphatase RsbU (regulator of sigma subunit)
MIANVRNYKLIYFGLAVFFWLMLTAFNLITFFTQAIALDGVVADFLANNFLCLFLIFLFLFFKIEVSTQRQPNQTEHLWQVFITGTTTILISLSIRFLISSHTFNNVVLDAIFYHVNLGLVSIFVASTFYVWKKLILYHKTSRAYLFWNIFEYTVLSSVITSFFFLDVTNLTFYLYASPILIITALVSFNVKWVALLSYKEKIRTIALTALILLISLTFLQQIYYQSEQNNSISINLWENVFVLGVLAFISFYAFISLFIVIMQMPTASIYDKKMEEAKVLQKLNAAIQDGDSEENIYDLILQMGMSTGSSGAGWLEIVDEKGNYKAFIHRNIDKIDVFEIKKVFRKNHIYSTKDLYLIKTFKGYSHAERIQALPYRSAIILPLGTSNESYGSLVLIKNMVNGFDKNAIDHLFNFSHQASMAIKNYLLIADALQNQRYKEELKIAKEVQNRLLPKGMTVNPNVVINAFSKAADDVGGDYYDLYEFAGKKELALVIGDVSGHGTTAAFNMAQVKGIFQSLIQLRQGCDTFMAQANKAVGACLEKRSFVTLSLYLIDSENHKIEYARAGHPPALFYSAKQNKLQPLEAKGLGLGILRNDDYEKHIAKETIHYETGDTMILYTDGIIEAPNENGEEYGVERLMSILEKNIQQNPKHLSDIVLEDLFSFNGRKAINDDYTLIIVKFI